MNTPYQNLPFMSNEDFPYSEYGEAAALRAPIARAINTARMQRAEKMEQVVAILETALAHIRQGAPDEVPEADIAPDVVDPLDELLGPSDA
jgi:hypothetical protein